MLPKTYDPKSVEPKIQKLWERSGYFNPDKLDRRHKKPFSITMAPPNITGHIHIGHALENTLSDVLARKRRMEGYKTLFLPGKDHAGIAAQYVVERELRKEGKTRFDLGREKFIGRMWQWMKENGDAIDNELKALGLSCDWSRSRFTMDKPYQEAVRRAFEHYYKKGWIYKGERAINWCPRCGTSISDLEVEYKDETAELYYIKYGPLVIATVRPETKLGDTAVAVNPKDKRYKRYIGKVVECETVLGPAKMKVIGDPNVDMTFGTGAMKVTPAHDLHDFELAERHGLAKRQVIGPDGKMTKLAGKYAGLTVREAREQIVRDMEKLGILVKVEPYQHRLAVCSRCSTALEPILSEQWFLSMKELAQKTARAVKANKIKFYPPQRKRIFLEWLGQVKDWNISRQLWWGHKIPLPGLEDVLDTWFSSALWPFATLGWPRRTLDLKKFYPTDVISSAREIFFLWIVRMTFSGLEFMGQIPFRVVYTHATVLDAKGRKMSKSLGNVVDPKAMIEKYGTDALRFGLTWQVTGTQDIHWDEGSLVAGKKFANKVWNAARFVLVSLPSSRLATPRPPRAKTAADRAVLKALARTEREVAKHIEQYELGQALRALYGFFWHQFCDRYLEASKKQLAASGLRSSTQGILLNVLARSLKLLHPFMPHITEELWLQLQSKIRDQRSSF